MRFKIAYWDAGDAPREKTVEAADVEAAIELLANDEQHPLGQVDTIELLDIPQ